MDGKRCGHCPTCSDFETLWQTVEDLKKQLASIQVWKQSINSQGCIFELEFKPDGTSWKKDPCEICHCQGGQTRCEPISGCQVDTSTLAPTPRESTPVTDDEEDEDDLTSASGDSPTTSTSDTTTTRPLSESKHVSINRRRLQ